MVLTPGQSPGPPFPGQAPWNITWRSRCASLSGSIRLKKFFCTAFEKFSLIDLNKNKMGVLSVRQNPHCTSFGPEPSGGPDYCYFDWFTCSGFPPSFLPGSISDLPFRVNESWFPTPVSQSFCNLLLRNLLLQNLVGVQSPLRVPAFTTNFQVDLLSLIW